MSVKEAVILLCDHHQSSGFTGATHPVRDRLSRPPTNDPTETPGLRHLTTVAHDANRVREDR